MAGLLEARSYPKTALMARESTEKGLCAPIQFFVALRRGPGNAQNAPNRLRTQESPRVPFYKPQARILREIRVTAWSSPRNTTRHS